MTINKNKVDRFTKQLSPGKVLRSLSSKGSVLEYFIYTSHVQHSFLEISGMFFEENIHNEPYFADFIPYLFSAPLHYPLYTVEILNRDQSLKFYKDSVYIYGVEMVPDSQIPKAMLNPKYLTHQDKLIRDWIRRRL